MCVVIISDNVFVIYEKCMFMHSYSPITRNITLG